MIAEASNGLAPEDIRVALVYGQDTRLGQCLVAELTMQGYIVVPRSSEVTLGRKVDELSQDIRYDIREKKADVVINCLVDPDPAIQPENWMQRYVMTSHSILQECRRLGTRLILCSHAQVYGKQGRSDLGFKEYAPPVCLGRSLWRPVMHAIESDWLMQNSATNSCAITSTHDGFRGYLLRLGELLSPRGTIPINGSYNTDQLSLDAAIGDMVSHKRVSHFTAANPNNFRLSPISSVTLAKTIASLCQKQRLLPSGVYNLGSTGGPTLAELASFLQLRLGRSITIVTRNDTNAHLPTIGLDSSQDINSEFFYARTNTSGPSWKDELDLVLTSRAAKLAPRVTCDYA